MPSSLVTHWIKRPHSPKEPRKCSGCKNAHKEHSWGNPGPYCTVPPDHLLARLSDLKGEKHEMMNKNVPEEQFLAEQLQKLKLEERVEKDTLIQNLQHTIAAQKQELVELQSPSSGFSLPKAAMPGNMLSMWNSLVLTTTKSPNLATSPKGPNVSAGLLLHKRHPGHPSCRLHTAKVPQLEHNPDGPLSAPQTIQELNMFLRPTHLAKGETVYRIIDFVDKIVLSVEDRILSKLGSTKLIVLYGPKIPILHLVLISCRHHRMCSIT